MKHAEVQLGHEYLSRVSGELVLVRVLTQTVTRSFGARKPRQVFVCMNLRTKKHITRSASALRPPLAPRAPHPCAEEIGLLIASARYDRQHGYFDRGQAARELVLALCSERNGGPKTRIARQAMVREFGLSW